MSKEQFNKLQNDKPEDFWNWCLENNIDEPFLRAARAIGREDKLKHVRLGHWIYITDKGLSWFKIAVRQSIASHIMQNFEIDKHLPFTYPELMAHLTKQFKPGMSWQDRKSWHIDHIIPKSKFKFKSLNDPQFQQCWSLENLRPLWATENMKKGSK